MNSPTNGNWASSLLLILPAFGDCKGEPRERKGERAWGNNKDDSSYPGAVAGLYFGGVVIDRPGYRFRI